MSLKTFKRKLFDIHGNNLIVCEESFVNIATPCTFFDSIYGSFLRAPKSILFYKTRHPQFRIDQVRKKSIQDIKTKLLTLHHGKVFLVEETFSSWDKKCDFIDVEYGVWSSTPSNTIRRLNGHPTRGLNEMSIKFRMSLDDVKKRILDVHGDTVTIVDDTYIGYSKNATFIDKEYGSWITKPRTVVGIAGRAECLPCAHPKRALAKRKKTFMEKYGVDSPMKLDSFQSKLSKAINADRTRINHWKTDEELICQGSYESAFVKWANENKIDFDWQIPHKMPNGKTYWVDAYIKSGKYKNNWLEIKGYFRKDAEEKWNWFHSENVNSIIWFKKDLKAIGIL